MMLLFVLLSPYNFSLLHARSVTVVPMDPLDKNINEFPYVGMVNNYGFYSLGSGIVIGDGTFVITAKHVLSDNGRPDGGIYPVDNYTFDHAGTTYKVEQVWCHPYSDVAIMKLKGKITSTVKIRNNDNLISSEFYGVGFGRSSSMPKFDKIEWDLGYGTKRVFKNTFSVADFRKYRATKDREEYVEKVMLFMVRNPAIESFERAIPGEGIFGPGDSGGGLFVKNEVTGEMELAASINSILQSGRVFGYGIDLVYIKKWISGIVPDAVALPKIEGPAVAPENSSNAFLEYAAEEVKLNLFYQEIRKRRVRHPEK
jgi:hypothetical protein